MYTGTCRHHTHAHKNLTPSYIIQHFKDTKFVVYGNNAPVGSSRAAGEVDFLQYRTPDEDFTEPIYPILVEIITMLDKSELKLDDQEIYMIKSCVKKHIKIIKSDIRIK